MEAPLVTLLVAQSGPKTSVACASVLSFHWVTLLQLAALPTLFQEVELQQIAGGGCPFPWRATPQAQGTLNGMQLSNVALTACSL